MDDIGLVNLTKIKLINLSRNDRLENLVIKHIVKNLHFFDPDNSEEINSIGNLNGVLRNRVLQGMLQLRCIDSKGNEHEFDRKVKALSYLLSGRTREINLEGLFSFHPSENYDEVLQIIAEKAPNVQILTIKSSSLGAGEWKKFTSASFEALCSMKRLRKLVAVRQWLTWDQMRGLCRSVPSLRVLGVAYVFDDPNKSTEEDLEGLKNDLAHLRLLRCSVTYQKLQHYLPNLDHIDHLNYYNLSWEDLEVPKDSTRRTKCLRNFFGRYNGPDPNLLPQHALPNITHICLDGHSFEERKESQLAMMQWPKIKSLTFSSLPSNENIDSLLMCFGKKLKSISFDPVWNKHHYSFENILKYCPNLEALHLGSVLMHDVEMPMKNFSKLKDLAWIAKREQKIVLCNLLSAPNLQKVDIGCEELDLQDLKRLISLISGKKILDHLESLRIRFHNQVSREVFDAVVTMLKYASAFLPKLIDIKITFEARHQASCDFLKLLTNAEWRKTMMLSWSPFKISFDENFVTIIKEFEKHYCG